MQDAVMLYTTLSRWIEETKNRWTGKRRVRPIRNTPRTVRPWLERLEDRMVPSVPSVTGISPSFGPTGGNTQVQITGSGFTGATAVNFGTTGSSEFILMSDTLIDAYSPREPAGVVDVTVTTPGGTSATTAADQFTYQLATTTTLTSSNNNPSTYGQSVTFTATVSSGSYGPPSGTVWFNDGGNVIGTATLSQGYGGAQATFTTSALTAGSHSITAVYGGDVYFSGSSSSTLTQTVQVASTTTTLSSSANPSAPGQAVAFTATVTGAQGGAPTGTVTFYDGSTVLGTGTLSPAGQESQATFTTSALASGAHSIKAVYGGDANFSGSSSSVLTQNVQNNGAYVWTGNDSSDPNDWNDRFDWLVNGSTPATAPSQNSDVIFGGPLGTSVNCSTSGSVSIHSITISSNYTGTLALVGALNVTAGFDMEGGAVNQVNGAGASDITVNGAFDWVNGILNSGSNLANMILTGDAEITGNNLKTTGDNFVVYGRLSLYGTGTWQFDDNAGITVQSGGSLAISDTMNLATSGSGIIQNNGGTFMKASDSNTTNRCDLPYVNNNQSATLTVVEGGLVFDKAGGPHGVSVYQAAGSILLGLMMGDTATLEADEGLAMDGGALSVADGATGNITGGNVIINGGTIYVGFHMPAKRDCQGFVTFNGGTYDPVVDMAANTCSVWHSDQNFTIKPNASLSVSTVNVPAKVPPHKVFAIMTASNLEPAGISGDFGAKRLGFGNAGQVYTADVSVGANAYDLTTP